MEKADGFWKRPKVTMIVSLMTVMVLAAMNVAIADMNEDLMNAANCGDLDKVKKPHCQRGRGQCQG